MADDEAHHQVVQEIIRRQRSFTAPFAPPTASLPGPATDSVPYTPDMQPQFDQLQRPPRSTAALEPASTFAHADLEAAIVGLRDTPLVLRAATAAAITKQEQPDHPSSHISPGVQDPPTETASPLSVAVEEAALLIVPTIYPDEPSGTVTVANHITINVQSADFREFTAKIDELLAELRRSNEIAGEVREKLVGEITAGMAILRTPKPDPKMVEVLLVRPLKYLADKAAGPVIGTLALAGLAVLGAALGKALF